MSSRFLQAYAGIVLVAAAVAIGCSQDPLNSGSQRLNVTYTPSPSGAGRFDTDSEDKALFAINKLQALPADPDQAALFGSERLTFVFSPFTADLRLETPVPFANAETPAFSNMALSVGTYTVTLLEVTPLQLVDNDIAPPSPTDECIDRREVIARSALPTQVPETITFRAPQDDLSRLSFTLTPGQTHLGFTVSVPGLIDGYESSFTCQFQPCPDPNDCPEGHVAVLTAFRTSDYRTALLHNISIH